MTEGKCRVEGDDATVGRHHPAAVGVHAGPGLVEVESAAAPKNWASP
jgi:hypothetical protein